MFKFPLFIPGFTAVTPGWSPGARDLMKDEQVETPLDHARKHPVYEDKCAFCQFIKTNVKP